MYVLKLNHKIPKYVFYVNVEGFSSKDWAYPFCSIETIILIKFVNETLMSIHIMLGMLVKFNNIVILVYYETMRDFLLNLDLLAYGAV